MRFDLRLEGRTSSGQACTADVSVYAKSQAGLKRQAELAATTASWEAKDGKAISEGETITVEHVRLRNKPS